MKPEVREELLALLIEFADTGGDPSGSHQEAEELLLEYLGDAEITAAWEDAAQQWWYA